MSTDNTSAISILRDSFDQVKETIRKDCSLTDISFRTWIEPLNFLTCRDQTVYIEIPSENTVQQSYLEKNYIDFFRVAISELIGENIEVVFLLSKDVESVTGKPPVENADLPDRTDSSGQILYDKNTGLNDKYRFDTFVVGNNNKFAHSAALAVAESPGKAYNPLFLYGGAGLGKTHLMHSIGHFVLGRNPEKKILYVTSENFTNEVIESIRSGRQDVITRLREKYRTVDVLLLDDVQFVIGKESTQEEFFHTFNELHQAGKQIVLSSDKPPKQMETLEERFLSRFEMGLIADIQSPDYETRMAILKKLGEIYPYSIDDTAYAYVADNIKSNIRELEGAFNKLIAHYRMENLTNLTEEDAVNALKDFLHPTLDRVITYSRVIDTVCEHYNIPQSEMYSKKRSSEIVLPRQIAMYLCREYVPNNSFKEIGQVLGGKDHTTVMSGVDKIRNSLKVDAEIVRTVDILTKKLNPV